MSNDRDVRVLQMENQMLQVRKKTKKIYTREIKEAVYKLIGRKNLDGTYGALQSENCELFIDMQKKLNSMFNGKADLFTYEKIRHHVAMRDKDNQPKKKASKKEEKASLQEANRIAAEQDAMKIEEENRERDATIENAAYFLKKSHEYFREGDIVVTTDEEENFAEYTFDLCETHVALLNALLLVPDFTSVSTAIIVGIKKLQRDISLACVDTSWSKCYLRANPTQPSSSSVGRMNPVAGSSKVAASSVVASKKRNMSVGKKNPDSTWNVQMRSLGKKILVKKKMVLKYLKELLRFKEERRQLKLSHNEEMEAAGAINKNRKPRILNDPAPLTTSLSALLLEEKENSLKEIDEECKRLGGDLVVKFGERERRRTELYGHNRQGYGLTMIAGSSIEPVEIITTDEKSIDPTIAALFKLRHQFQSRLGGRYRRIPHKVITSKDMVDTSRYTNSDDETESEDSQDSVSSEFSVASAF